MSGLALPSLNGLVTNTSQGPVLDKSVQILGQLFGTSATEGISSITAQVSGAPTSTSLLTQIIGYFDVAAFSVILLIFSYMVIMATINTAHEGTAFGRQYNTTYTLIRNILGPVLMFPLPTASSGIYAFSVLQKIVMKLILVGIVMANSVWTHSVGASMATPPTQLPGPIKNLVAEEVGKIYVYDSVYKMMGLDTLNSSAKLTVNKATKEYGPKDAQLYNYIMDQYSNACLSDNPTITMLGNMDNIPQTQNVSKQCLRAASQMKQMLSPGILYPLVAGRLLNSNTDRSPSNLNPSSNLSAAPIDAIGAGTAQKFMQYHLHFGDNAPYYNNGMIDIPAGAYYTIQGFKTQNASGATPPDGVPAGPTDVANALQTQGLDAFILNLNPNQNGNSGTTPTHVVADAQSSNTLGPWSMNSQTPTIQTCAWSSSTNTCNLGILIKNYTNALIFDQEKKAAAQGLANAIVPGTGKTCTATWRNSVSGAPSDAPPGATQGETPDATLSSSSHVGLVVYTKQCYRKTTTYTQNKDPVASYTPIPAQNFSTSWWYGSEVYLAINQQLADNIKAITQEIGRFAIQDNALTLSSMVGTKSTHLVDSVAVRDDWGHALDKNYDLLSGDTSGSSSRTAKELDIDYGPGKTFNSSTVSLPNWSEMICIFNPNGTGFLNSSSAACELGTQASKLFPSNDSVLTTAGTNDLIGNQQLFDALQSMPASFQNPIKLLLYWEINVNFSNVVNQNKDTPGPAVIKNIKGLENSLLNVIRVLKVNHMYPGSSAPEPGVNTSNEIDPAKTVLTEMFNKVLGNNPTGQMNDPNMGNVIGGLMQEIYSLGNSDIAPAQNTDQSEVSTVLSNSFNNVAKAQQIGIHMINVVIFGMESVYNHIRGVANNYINQDHKIYESIEKKAIAAGTIGAAGGIAGAFIPGASSAASAIQSSVQMWAMVDQIKLQTNMVKQSYSLSSIMMWLPLIFTTSIALFTAGVSFAMIVPVMPFILFWAGQVSWLLSVIEAIVAAPLICLAWTTPGGHQHFGHILGGIKILTGIIFRPVLMVIGLFTAMILTYVLIKFSSQAFQIVSTQILNYADMSTQNTASYLSGMGTAYAKNSPLVQGILAVLMLLLYCSLMVMAFNKCYSTIYMIPEKVLGWIGSQVDRAGAQEAEKISSGVQQSASQAGQAGQQVGSQGAQAQSSHAQQSGSADASNAGTSLQMANTGSGAGQQTGKAIKEGKKGGSGADGGGLEAE